MSKKTAFIFPGQGAQIIGMGKDLYENFESAKNVFDTADKVLGKSITTLCFHGPEDLLRHTVNTQPCIVTMSIAALEALKSSLDIKPDYTAGHSLGEYSAMYASGVMSLETVLRAIQKRADVMNSSNKNSSGIMSAIINPPEKEIFEKCLKEASALGYVDVANYNSPSQIVLTGEYDAVEKAGCLMLQRGARRAVMLSVSGAFHSKMMQNAARRFETFVKELQINDASVPVITNVDATETISGAEFRVKMPRQICSSVYWTQTVQKMAENGVEIFVEIGPGKVLSGLNKKIAPDAKAFSIFDKASLEETVASLKEELALV